MINVPLTIRRGMLELDLYLKCLVTQWPHLSKSVQNLCVELLEEDDMVLKYFLLNPLTHDAENHPKFTYYEPAITIIKNLHATN